METSFCAPNSRGLSTSIHVAQNQGIAVGLGLPTSYVTNDTGLVLVTGASGFIASQIVDLLMRSGYRVRGSVRCLQNRLKIDPLLRLGPNSKYPLELIEADLNNHDSWDRAVQGCSYVIHVASPFPAEAPEDENEIIKPAVNGTLSVLQFSHRHRVKRVVLTSSIAAIFGDLGDRDPPGKVFTENDWTNPANAKDAYVKSKALSERAAWDFLAQLPENERFELAVLNPTYVFGPLLCGVPGTTAVILLKPMTRDIPLIPRFNFPSIDVRDVALAHMRAMTLPQAAGRRTIVHSGCNLWVEDMAKLLDHELKPQDACGYDIPTQRCPSWILQIYSLFDKTVKRSLPLDGKYQDIDGSKTMSILGITPRDVRQSIIDMGYSLIEGGFIRKTKKYKGQGTNYNNPPPMYSACNPAATGQLNNGAG